MIATIIVEYNPLHNGHIYHINQTKQLLKQLAPNEDNSIIAIMSGNFTQRGDISMLNKYTRAKHAIFAGVDMVIELPVVYATSSAEYFSNGAIQIANKIKDLGLICFGAECDNFDTLNMIAELSTKEEYNNLIKSFLNDGHSYPVACEKTMQKLTKIDTKIVNSPNNILGIEYIKQAKKLNCKAKLIPIKRIGGGYNEDNLTPQFNSAKSIRLALSQNITDTNLLKIPQFVCDDLTKSKIDYDKFFAIIANKCIDMDNVYEDNEGVINRIKKYSQIANNYEELVELVHTKRYTKSKIKRILTHISLGHKSTALTKIGKPNILAVNEEKKHLLSKVDFSGDEVQSNLNSNANKIYNILSNDKISSDNMVIIKANFY